MALLEQWQKVAYNEKADRGELQRFWQRYFLLEKGVYEQLLTNPDEKVEGTVKELADWLYELPQWKEIFDDEKRRALFLEQKKSGTVHVGKKVGRNDPCPCGSGKKYKYCCGR